MNFKKFKLEDGATDCFVNLDMVIAARPDEGGRTISLYTPYVTMKVDAAQFQKAVAEDDNPLPGRLTRLVQALDRLSARIPASVRLHL